MATRRPKRKNAGWRKTGLGKRSIRAAKKRFLKEGHSRESVRRLVKHVYKANAPKVKGRKVKGGRAVTLKNFTGSVVRKANGQVVIKGKGRK